MQNENQYEKIVDNMMVFMPLMRGVFHSVLKKQDSGNKEINILNSRYPILGVLNKRGAMPMSEIGELLGISKPNMTALVDKIIAEKEATRVYDDKDRRIIKIEIAEKGRKTLRLGKEMIKEEFKNRLKDLTKEDLNRLSRSLEDAKTILSKINDSKIFITKNKNSKIKK